MNRKKDAPIRFKVSRWIMLSFAILLNSFIIVYSCIDEDTTASWNSTFTNLIANVINSFTHKEVEVVPLEAINVSFSTETSYKYNYIPGYKLEEIPLGSAKQIECFFAPSDATNQAVTYTATPSDSVVLNQSGSTLSVVGMKTGDCSITATSSDGGFTSSLNLKIVETVAPVNYEISLKKTDIAIGTTETINFDINGGVLGHNELVNFRYYDTRKLTYSSQDETIAKVDEYGVIYPQNVGSTTISVKNGDYQKSIDVTIKSGSIHPDYSHLLISGSNVCYANDMILDQSSNKNHYQLTPKDGETELNPEDFIWSSSNELLVKVDKYGVVRGFRKTSNNDEVAIITAKSKLTGQAATFNIVVKNQLPTNMYFWFVSNGKEMWNHKEHTFFVGDHIIVYFAYSPNTQTKDVVASTENESVVSITNEGSSITLHMVSEGSSLIKMTSVINPDLTVEMRCDVIPPGAISEDNVSNLGVTIRKSLGHAAVFMIAQVFTFLTLYMFFYDKKWWFYSSISIGEGLFVSGLSELIQFFIPSRDGTFIDVLIDFAGVIVGAALTFLGIYIVKKIKEKKSQKEISEK